MAFFNADRENSSALRLFFAYFTPALISMLVLSSYTIVDGIFVGKGIGEFGLAAIGLCAPIFSFFIGVELLFGIGGATLISIALGAKKPRRARIIFSSIVYISLILGIFFGAIMFIFREKLAYLLGSNDTLLPFVLPYLSVIVCASFIMILHSILCTFARNDNAPNLAMISFVASSIINAVCDYVFIFIFKLGMFGAAFATILGTFVGLLIVLRHFLRKKGELFFVRALSKVAILDSVKSGTSPSVSEFSFGFITLLMNVLLIKYGTETHITILSIMMYVGMICFGSILAVSHGLQPIVSCNFGAKNFARVIEMLKISLIFSTIIGILMYVFLFFFVEIIAMIFLPSDTEILEQLARAVRIYFLGYLFLGGSIIAASFLQAINRVLSSTMISLSLNLIFMLILLPLLAIFFGIDGIWASYPISLICALIVSAVILRREIQRF